MSNKTQLQSMHHLAEFNTISRTPIDSVTESQADMTGEAAAAEIITQRPELAGVIGTINITADMHIQDILREISDDVDTSGISISDTKEGHLFIDQIADLAIPATEDTHIVIESYGAVILDNFFSPGLDGYIHLDLRDMVFENTSIVLPAHRDAEGDDYKTYMEQEGSGLLLDISVESGEELTSYHLWVNAFHSAAKQKMSDIDRIDIPSDALIPLTVYRENEVRNAPVKVYLVTATRRTLLHEGIIGEGDGYLINTDVPVSRIPYRMFEPFYLEFQVTIKAALSKTVRTPVYRVTTARAQQYLFLNDYGHFDIVPMTGALTFAPEYELENSFRTNSVERAKATRRSRYTQNSGPLSRQTAVVLSSLLLSRKIYAYTPGETPRRIVVEDPSVSISSHNPINTVTFTWRYADN